MYGRSPSRNSDNLKIVSEVRKNERFGLSPVGFLVGMFVFLLLFFALFLMTSNKSIGHKNGEDFSSIFTQKNPEQCRLTVTQNGDKNGPKLSTAGDRRGRAYI